MTATNASRLGRIAVGLAVGVAVLGLVAGGSATVAADPGGLTAPDDTTDDSPGPDSVHGDSFPPYRQPAATGSGPLTPSVP